ncbi:hypothetical protein [Parafrankia sp. FMc2]|uniref:hypothetical protein n=1 Tax=Parafrankia sp. FMc2 TaxID=3233196 RepID=UPI0034D3E560
MRRWSTPAAAGVRDWISFLAGLAGVAHETLAREVDRPALLLLFAALMGLPFALQADQAQREHAPEPPAPPAEPPPGPPDGPGDAGPPPSPTSRPRPP